MSENNVVEKQPPTGVSWAIKLFSKDVESEYDPSVELYTGEDEKDKDEPDWFNDQMEEEDTPANNWPQIKVTREERLKLSKP